MLRNRLYLGLLPLLLITASLGVYAIYLLADLSGSFRSVSEQRHATIVSARAIAADMQHLDIVPQLADQNTPGPAQTIFASTQARVNRELNRLLQNSSGKEETRLIDELSARWQEAQAAISVLVSAEPTHKPAAGFAGAAPKASARLRAVEDAAQCVADHNERLIAGTEKDFQLKVDLSINLMLLGILAAMLLALIFSYAMGARIVRPIEELTATTRELARGNLDRTAKMYPDEMGTLSKSLNEMTQQLREYRRTTDHKLLLAQQTMRAMFNHFPDPIFFVNERGEATFKNARAFELFAAPEWKDGPPAELQDILDEALHTRQGISGRSLADALILRERTEEHFFLPFVVPIEQEEGVRGLAVILQDVTKLRLSDDLKSNLFATVSHELKTPLTSARMAVYLLREEQLGPLNDEQRDLVVTAQQELDRLLKTIQDLLDLGRTESSEASLHIQQTSPRGLLESAQHELETTAESRKVKLRLRVDEDVPTVDADPDRIHFVLTSYLLNALRNSPENSEVVLGVRRDPGGVRFYVTDHGKAIPEDATVRVFSRFFRPQSEGRESPTVGLSICREILLAHGGQVGCTRPADGGSEFFFILPTRNRRRRIEQQRISETGSDAQKAS